MYTYNVYYKKINLKYLKEQKPVQNGTPRSTQSIVTLYFIRFIRKNIENVTFPFGTRRTKNVLRLPIFETKPALT